MSFLSWNLRLFIIRNVLNHCRVVCNQHGQDEGIIRNLPAELVVWPKSTEEVSAIGKIYLIT